MKYLEILEKQIWQSDKQDNKIFDLLYCELQKVNSIIEHTKLDWAIFWHNEKENKTIQYERKYKEKIFELLELIK